MIAFGLGHIVIFVFDLPARTARSRNLHDRLSLYVMISDKAVVIHLFTRFRMHDGELKPMDRQGTFM
jgi:hypothetical protein